LMSYLTRQSLISSVRVFENPINDCWSLWARSEIQQRRSMSFTDWFNSHLQCFLLLSLKAGRMVVHSPCSCLSRSGVEIVTLSRPKSFSDWGIFSYAKRVFRTHAVVVLFFVEFQQLIA
jgi:hypothetical protein